jgi:putative transposase
MEMLAGIDFFTVEVLTRSGLATYYVLFLIHLESRRITIAGITRHPTETWIEQMARNVTDESTGCLRDIHYVLHDRDTKFCASFESILTVAGVKPLKLPARSPNLNGFAERWVRAAKEECLSRLILSAKAR